MYATLAKIVHAAAWCDTQGRMLLAGVIGSHLAPGSVTVGGLVCQNVASILKARLRVSGLLCALAAA